MPRTADSGFQNIHVNKRSFDSQKVLAVQTKTCNLYLSEINYWTLLKIVGTLVARVGKYRTDEACVTLYYPSLPECSRGSIANTAEPLVLFCDSQSVRFIVTATAI